MSAEYALRMDVLRNKREELTSRRVALEKKIALREATAAEFSAVAQQSYTAKWKRARAAAVSAKARNDEFIRSLHAMQQRAHEALVQQRSDLSASTALLAREKARYAQKIETVYPAWQERQQVARLQKLRVLEDKKRAVEQRRHLAKKTFEKERSLDDLIRQTSHEIELAESLEQNEGYERELLRRQSAVQSARLDHSIREHALGARSYMAEQGHAHIRDADDVDEHVADTLFETFSPRSALQALQHANRSLSFDEPPNRQHDRAPAPRSLTIEIPRASRLAHESDARPQQQERFANEQQRYDEILQQQKQVMRHAETTVYTEAARSLPLPDTLRMSNVPLHGAELTVAPTVPVGERVAASVFVSQSGTSAGTTTRLSSVASSNPASPAASWLQPTTSSAMFSQPLLPPTTVDPSATAAVPTSLTTSIAAADARIDDSAAAVVKTSAAMSVSTVPTTQQQAAPLGTADQQTARSSDAVNASEPPAVALLSWTVPLQANERSTPTQRAVFSTQPLPLSAPAPGAEPQQTDAGKTSSSASATHINSGGLLGVGLDAPRLGRTQSEDDNNDGVTSMSADRLPNEQSAVDSANPTLVSVASSFSGQSNSIVLSDELVASYNASSTIGASALERTVDLTLDLVTSLDSSASQFGASAADRVVTPLASAASTLELKDRDDVASSEQCRESAYQSSTHIDDDRAIAMTSLDDERLVHPIDSTGQPAALSGHTLDICAVATETQTRVTVVESSVVTAFAVESITSSAEVPTLSGDVAPVDALDARVDDALAPDASDSSVAQYSKFDSRASHADINSVVLPATETGGLAIDTNELSRNDSDRPPIVTAITTASTSEIKYPDEASTKLSPIERLSMADKVKVLSALITRVEAGATDGDEFNATSDGDSASSAAADSKRELVRMAVGDRKAQINFFGSDICLELILDVARAVGPALFPLRAFEGIMSEQKLRKVHQHSKDKELELWKLLSTHMKQLATLKALSVAAIADRFGTAFLHHDLANQRSLRKARLLSMNELLHNVCGAKASSVSPKKDVAASPSPSRGFSYQTQSPRSEASGKRDDGDDDDDAFERSNLDTGGRPSHLSQQVVSALQPSLRSEATSLLQTAFLQHQSPPKPKTFGLASASSYKKKSDTQDVFQSMASSPAKLSHKLLRGGKMADYSEFEDDEGVDLQNLIGSRGGGLGSSSVSSMAAPSSPSASGSFKTSTRTGGASVSIATRATAKDSDDFDVDF